LEYLVAVHGAVEALIPVVYAADLESTRGFYELFGFTEQSAGGDGTSRWCYLRAGELTILVVAVQPRLITVELPLLIYLYVDDLNAVTQRLAEADHAVDRVGYPDHAPGGEARTKDPDGNVVLIGQRVANPAQSRVEPTGDQARFSLIRQAAEAVARRGGAPARCQIPDAGGRACERAAEVKLADSWGDSAWACVEHADETLLLARSVFLATEDGQGLGPFLQARVRA
jgi:hypothetical protein